MKRQRIYVMPTGFGYIYVVGVVATLLIGAAYQNNIVNLLAFFMFSFATVGVIQTHANLRRTWVEAIETEGGFAGDGFLLTAIVANDSRLPRFGIQINLPDRKPLTNYNETNSLPGKGRLRIRNKYFAESRGRHRVGKIRLSSVYPIGLFVAWTWYEPVAEYVVYPKPDGEIPLPSSDSSQLASGRIPAVASGEDFSGHRKFMVGDSLRHVDWKAVARGRPMMTKEFNDGESGGILLLDSGALSGLDLETRLSQLARWVELAKDRRLPFALQLPGRAIISGIGIDHAVRCWEALADFEQPDRIGVSRNAA